MEAPHSPQNRAPGSRAAEQVAHLVPVRFPAWVLTAMQISLLKGKAADSRFGTTRGRVGNAKSKGIVQTDVAKRFPCMDETCVRKHLSRGTKRQVR
ncbi:MAG: hypothetical protein C0469_05225 [Cyanobacteria bacterium DS2.3.42]|nr:hypothetical protein [Cyanobacteria bacterium DS2.3.42]